MQVNNAMIALTGESGDGIISLGEVFAKILVKMGLNVLTFRSYPAEVRGGQCIYTINSSEDQVLSQGNEYDILVCTDTIAYTLNHRGLRSGGVLIFNSESIPQEQIRELSYGVPLKSLTSGSGLSKSKNIVILGVLARLFSLDMDIAKRTLQERWGKNSEAIEQNLRALKAGYEWTMANAEKKDELRFNLALPSRKFLVSGNEALCLGAVAAGCRFYAGYPITPASDLLEWLMDRLPRVGGIAIQVEDEISAFGAAIGASYSGVRSMTATSGPGLALMTEFVNLAGAAEIPIVVVDVQRAGPSTGMPTKTEQSDLNHAVFGGPGEAPRIVIAPTRVEDCFYQMIKAFNLADKYQIPVILLSDQSLSHRLESIPTLDPTRIQLVTPKRPSSEELTKYRRYVRTEDGVSPMSIPGMVGGSYVATGIEREEDGKPSYEPETHQLNMEKRMRKLERAALEDAEVEQYGSPDARVGIISWGSTTGAVREAVQMAARRGLKLSSLHPKLLFPTPKKEIGLWLSQMSEVLVVEVNQSGQYHHILQSEFGRSLRSMRKATGLPFTPQEVLAKIEEVASIGG